MSSQPSPSASNRATPEPMVSGRYFLPARPLLWVKRTPEALVTSVNFTAGAGGAALGGGAAAIRARAARERADGVKRCFKDSISWVALHLKREGSACRGGPVWPPWEGGRSDPAPSRAATQGRPYEA